MAKKNKKKDKQTAEQVAVQKYHDTRAMTLKALEKPSKKLDIVALIDAFADACFTAAVYGTRNDALLVMADFEDAVADLKRDLGDLRMESIL